MRLIVGLGNAGPQYDGTRHNVGFDVIDTLAHQWRVELNTEKFHAWFGQADVGGQKVVLLKPTTFMNRSGQAVDAAGRFYKLEFSDLLIICDDLALPVGKLRMRASGSAGSHNGLQNIIDRVGGDQWARLRIGIGERVGEGASFVLSRFSRDEEPIIDRAVLRAAKAVECWIADGVDKAMSKFNGDVEPS